MNLSAKYIDKARHVVIKRVSFLEEKIKLIHEKYPEDMFGLKADAMCIDYEAELLDLQRWLDPNTEMIRVTKKNMELCGYLLDSRRALERAQIVMRQNREFTEANIIESVLKKIPLVGY